MSFHENIFLMTNNVINGHFIQEFHLLVLSKDFVRFSACKGHV